RDQGRRFRRQRGPGARAAPFPSGSGRTALVKKGTMNPPPIGITMGDPCGVGPEVIVKSLLHPDVRAGVPAIVIGDPGRLRQAAERTGSNVPVLELQEPEDALAAPAHAIRCLPAGAPTTHLPFGQLRAEGGAAAYAYIDKAVQLAMAGRISAVCTAPL